MSLKNTWKKKPSKRNPHKQEAKPLSAYEGCVLKESAKIHELIAEAQKDLDGE